MKVENLFQNLQETPLLEQLSSEEKIFFIGNKKIVEQLKLVLNAQKKQLDNNYYCFWQPNKQQAIFEQLAQAKDYKSIIIVSPQNEQNLFELISKQVKVKQIEIPVLRLLADVFINCIAGRNLLATKEPELKLPQITYAIFTTPRSGSTFLCSVLQSLKIAGFPSEHLRQASAFLAKNCQFDYIELFKVLMCYKKTYNDVFGTKFISHFLEVFQKTEFDFDQIFSSISKYIYLVRRDKVAQAVSIVLAQQTQVWHIANQEKQKSYQTKLQQIQIEDSLLEEVHKQYYFIKQQEEYLNELFDNYKISPLIVEYEQLNENLEEQIHQILVYLEIIEPGKQVTNLQSHLQKMRSSLSQEIITRYQEKYNHPS